MGRGRSRLRTAGLLVGVALFGYLLLELGPRSVGAVLAGLGPDVLLVPLLFAAYQLARAEALRRCFATAEGFSFRDAVLVRVAGEAVRVLSFTGPVLAEPTKAWLLTRHAGLSTRQAAAATLTEYLVYTLSSAALSLVGLLLLLRSFELARPLSGIVRGLVVLLGAFLAVAIVAIALRIYLIGAVARALARLPLLRGPLGGRADAIREVEDRLLAVLRDAPGRLAGIAAFELAGHGLLVAEVAWLLRAMRLDAGPVEALLVEAATKPVNFAFFFVPAQLGVAEGASVVVFGVLGLPAAAGFTLSFVRRLRTLAVAAAGLLALAILK